MMFNLKILFFCFGISYETVTGMISIDGTIECDLLRFHVSENNKKKTVLCFGNIDKRISGFFKFLTNQFCRKLY